ncbi:hypothetical protein [Microcoleus sp. D3_18_C4]
MICYSLDINNFVGKVDRPQASSECDRPVHYFLCRVRHHPIA